MVEHDPVPRKLLARQPGLLEEVVRELLARPILVVARLVRLPAQPAPLITAVPARDVVAAAILKRPCPRSVAMVHGPITNSTRETAAAVTGATPTGVNPD